MFPMPRRYLSTVDATIMLNGLVAVELAVVKQNAG